VRLTLGHFGGGWGLPLSHRFFSDMLTLIQAMQLGMTIRGPDRRGTMHEFNAKLLYRAMQKAFMWAALNGF
jgi:hypothetical protein